MILPSIFVRNMPEKTLAPIVFKAVLILKDFEPTVRSYLSRVCTLNSTANPIAVTRLTTDTALIMIWVKIRAYRPATEDQVRKPNKCDHAEDGEDDDDCQVDGNHD